MATAQIKLTALEAHAVRHALDNLLQDFQEAVDAFGGEKEAKAAIRARSKIRNLIAEQASKE